MRENYRLFLKNNELGNSDKYISLVCVGHAKALDLDFWQIRDTMKTILGKIDD